VRRIVLISLVVSMACVRGPRALSPSELEAFATRQHAGDFADVFDATVLALEHEGLSMQTVDRVAGTLEARRPDGTGYDVSVTAAERVQRVVLRPVPERERWVLEGEAGETARWDAVELHTTALLAAWRELPEWTIVAERNAVSVPGFRALVPEDWEKLEPSVSRRVLTAQRSRSLKKGFNPTWHFEVKRRAPREDHRPFLVETAGLALFARTRLRWPEEDRLTFAGYEARGGVRLADGSLVRPVLYAVWVGVSDALTVRVAAVCGPAEDPQTGCAAAWRDFLATLTTGGFKPP
jgi:hypothetical protein